MILISAFMALFSSVIINLIENTHTHGLVTYHYNRSRKLDLN